MTIVSKDNALRYPVGMKKTCEVQAILERGSKFGKVDLKVRYTGPDGNPNYTKYGPSS